MPPAGRSPLPGGREPASWQSFRLVATGKDTGVRRGSRSEAEDRPQLHTPPSHSDYGVPLDFSLSAGGATRDVERCAIQYRVRIQPKNIANRRLEEIFWDLWQAERCTTPPPT